MATTIRISGVDIERVKGSLQIFTAIEQRSTASFVVVDRLGTATYIRGQSVEIFTSLAVPPFIYPQFNGFIDAVVTTRISPSSPTLYHAIQYMDAHYLADKRRCAEAYGPQTAGFIANDLYTKYLQPEGVIIGEIQAGPIIPETLLNYSPVSLAYDGLATRANFIWYIDRFKRLFFVVRTTTPAPFAITDVDIVRDEGMASELVKSNPLYRNRQFVRAGRDVTTPQTEDRTGDAETKSFAMGYPLNQEPIITVGGAPQVEGVKGLDDPAITVFWAKGDPVITFKIAPGVGAAIVVLYIGEYDIMIQVEDAPEIAARKAVEGGTGIVESMEDAPTVNSKQAAFDDGLALLEKYGVIGKQFSFPIRVWGIEPGQMVTVTYAEYGLNAADLLVESVEIAEFAPGELRYTVKAIEGPELGDWTGFFKTLANMKEEVLGRLNVGSDQILIILASVPENWEWSETITEMVYACPICDAGLLCGPGVIVC